MQLLICVVPVCAVRAEPSHRSEQVTQLLFGEGCLLLQQTGDFVQVRILYDGYEGWCQFAQLSPTSQEVEKVRQGLSAGFVNEIHFNHTLMHVPFGCPVSHDFPNHLFGSHQVTFSGAIMATGSHLPAETLVLQLAGLYLNAPYQWGGRSVYGVDCSGFTQMVYKCMGIPLRRDASQQALQGEVVGFLQEARCGDLAFFDNEAGHITHVGILLTADSIVHASGRVRIDTIDTQGIVNRETGKRTHKLRIVKRLIQQ